MRIYISADMEGITGVAVGKHADYVRAFKQFWGCLIVEFAVAEGLL